MRRVFAIAAVAALVAMPATAGFAPILRAQPPVQTVGMPFNFKTVITHPPCMTCTDPGEEWPGNPTEPDNDDDEWLDPPYPPPGEDEPDDPPTDP
jgi:hypothetical protein